ncbi:MAG TPA: glycine--tRNA ligase subunit beta, partial [Thermotogota bacterium]|nr:glycine--tRNA ligase subunit beta [Thermotogota bacterium]
LEEQYSQSVPESVAGAVLSVADKMDVLCGNLWLGNVPSGSKDPYGLRRKLYQIIETYISYNWDLRLDDLFRQGLKPFVSDRPSGTAPSTARPERSEDALLQTFKELTQSRLEFYLQGKGLPYDIIRAVQHQWATPMRAAIVAQNLQEFRTEPVFLQISTLFERVHNITRNVTDTDFDSRLFENEAEKELYIRYTETKDTVLSHIRRLNYRDALIGLMELKNPIDRYFDDVFVMVDREDLRLTRLRFLKSIDHLFMAVADLSMIEKDGGAQPDSVVSEKQNPEERGIPNGE